MGYKTPQEEFWASEFGAGYRERNADTADAHASNIAFFAQALRSVSGLRRIIEFGANIGLNIRALRTLFPAAELSAIEINAHAHAQLAALCNGKAILGSVLEVEPEPVFDLAFTKCFLIHIQPEHLDEVYRRLHACSRRYILVAEYHNPVPVTIPYRGHEDRLFKRDFAGGLLDAYPDLVLVDYGFVYARDPKFPQDDVTWFLLEKRPAPVLQG
jgi:pseudaminic acid biosynthesis-associated methylase